MKKVKPPANIEGEALLEWERITAELDAAGLLAETDRAILILYCRTWGTWYEADLMVAKFGSTIKYSNGVPGEAPFAKTAEKQVKILASLLEKMGLTPAERLKREAKAAKQKPVDDESTELKF